MPNHFHMDQLDILGFNAEYRFLILLTVGLLIVTFIISPCIRLLVRHRYSALIVFFLTSGLLTIAVLLYERYRGLSDVLDIWLKVMGAYSFLYALLLFVGLLFTKRVA